MVLPPYYLPRRTIQSSTSPQSPRTDLVKQTVYGQYPPPHTFKTAVANTFEHESRRVVRSHIGLILKEVRKSMARAPAVVCTCVSDPIRTQLRSGKSRLNDYLARINALETDQMWMWSRERNHPAFPLPLHTVGRLSRRFNQ